MPPSDRRLENQGTAPPVGHLPGRLLAIGDIHGCVKPLRAILDALTLESTDTLVVLGDFINRGPATQQVIEVLIQVAQQCELILILGNHEEELLAARKDPVAFKHWLSMGGVATLASYGVHTHLGKTEEEWAFSESGPPKLEPESLQSIPAEHWQVLEGAQDWWECDHFFFTHAGYDPQRPLDRQSATELRWLAISDWQVQPHCSGKTAIVGHSANLAGRVVDFGFLRCLDTGCGLGGCLTAMDIRTGQQWRCAEDSEKVVWQ